MKHFYKLVNCDTQETIVFDKIRYAVHEIDLGSIDNNISDCATAGQYGATIINQQYETRDISITGYVLADNVEDMMEARSKLQRVVSFNHFFDLIIDDKYFIRLVARRTPKYSTEHYLNNEQLTLFTLDCMAGNPFFALLDAVPAELAGWTKDFHFPKVFPQNETFTFGHKQESTIVSVINRGEVPADLTIHLRAINGNVKDPYFINLTTGEHMKLLTDMKSREEILIETSFSNKKVFNETIKKNLLANLTLDSSFISLPIGESKIKYGWDESKSDGTLELTMTYTPLFIGV